MSDTISEDKHEEYMNLPTRQASFFARLGYLCKLWVIKIAAATIITWYRLRFPPRKHKPTVTRRYPCRPALPVRIFKPRGESSKTELRPLYLNIHGGGFATCDASVDDLFCSAWCQRTGMIIASLNYSKAPLHPFPEPVLDIAAVASAVIDDESLPIDRSRLVVGGFSAGANLALASTMLPELHSKIRAIVSYYPIVGWTFYPHEKFATRLDTTKPTEPLLAAGPSLIWGYVSPGQNRRDPLLSPACAKREQLPKHVCIVGAQHDMLTRESRDMIYSLAGKDVPKTGWEDGFEDANYKWMYMKGVRHGFVDNLQCESPRALERLKKCEPMFESINMWLRNSVLNAPGGRFDASQESC